MDPIASYKQRVIRETKLRSFALSMYKQYWRSMRKMTCSQRAAMSAYKMSSEVINSILWQPEQVETLRNMVTNFVLNEKISIVFIKDVVKRFLEDHLGKIASLESLFTKAPRLERQVVVYRGINKIHSSAYEALNIGDNFVPRNFLSTSFNLDIAIAFSGWGPEPGSLAHIILPTGTPYLLLPGGAMSNYSDVTTYKELMADKRFMGDEMELLLNKNSTFELLKVEVVKLAPSTHFGAKSYTEIRQLKLYTLKLVESPDQKFEVTADQLMAGISRLCFSLE